MATVASLGETDLIRRVIAPLLKAGESSNKPAGWKLRQGIGDDAAVLSPPAGRDLLFASDMLVEGVHFRRNVLPAKWIGWKALARNISDIAAMGGRPVAAVVSLGAPGGTDARLIRGIYQGLASCARYFRMAIVGGDTTKAAAIVVDVSILGDVASGKAVLRSGVRPGDALFVTGSLGNSYASGRHARFVPRVAEAQAVLRRLPIHGMIDLSDGLASGLRLLSQASRVRLSVDLAAVPLARGARSVEQAMNEGEDFELLFAVSGRLAGRVPRMIGRVPIMRIGQAARGQGVRCLDDRGKTVPLPGRGFEHFSARERS